MTDFISNPDGTLIDRKEVLSHIGLMESTYGLWFEERWELSAFGEENKELDEDLEMLEEHIDHLYAFVQLDPEAYEEADDDDYELILAAMNSMSQDANLYFE